ncbi:MAG: tetratricopeptide repeat protein [Deltaproteobacteria bacterium]
MNLTLVALLTAQAVPSTDPDASAEELARRGRRAFTLEAYDEAVDLLSKAYRKNGDPALLFGIAQAYRKSDRCDEAVEFYERYRAACTGDCRMDSRTPTLIAKSKETCAAQRATAAAPPRGIEPEPDGPPRGPGVDRKRDGTAPGEARVDPPAGAVITESPDITSATKAMPWRAQVEAAGAAIQNGDVSGLQSSFRGAVGYGFGDGALRVGPTAGLELLPVAYEHEANGTILLVELSARAALRYALSDRFALRAEAGLGVLITSGQGEGVPLRTDRTADSATLPTFIGAVGADVWVTETLGLATTLQARTTLGRGALADGLTIFTFGGGPTVRW